MDIDLHMIIEWLPLNFRQFGYPHLLEPVKSLMNILVNKAMIKLQCRLNVWILPIYDRS